MDVASGEETACLTFRYTRLDRRQSSLPTPLPVSPCPVTVLPFSKMIIANFFSFSSLALIIRIACHSRLVLSVDWERDMLSPHHANDSSSVGSGRFPGFGHIVTSSEDSDSGNDDETGSDSDDEDDDRRISWNYTGSGGSFGSPDVGSTPFTGCSCVFESLSCDCIGDSVHEVPKNFTKHVSRM